MEFLAWIYPASSTLLILFYIPQITSVLKAKSPLNHISLLSWGVWSVCPIISFFYSLLIAHDAKIALFALLNAIGAFVIFAAVTYKRFYKYKIVAESSAVTKAPLAHKPTDDNHLAA
jgi:hypothetical protein